MDDKVMIANSEDNRHNCTLSIGSRVNQLVHIKSENKMYDDQQRTTKL